MKRLASLALLTAALVGATTSSAAAQNYSVDARRIALAGTGSTPNVATDMIGERRRYRSIVIPFGLIRVLTDYRVFFPRREDFDFVKAVEYAYRPLHLTIGRRDNVSGSALFTDIRRGEVSQDLNAYRGFDVAESADAEGLLAPNWGKTFVLREDDKRSHGLYVGAGPYFAVTADAAFDAQLVNLLGSESNIYIPDASFGATGRERHQLSLAITGGYRGRFPLPSVFGSNGTRDGIYFAANFHYLHGLRLDEFSGALRLETNFEGLLTGEPSEPPVAIKWERSTAGRGLSADVGVAFAVGHWDFGVGANGIGNRIVWRKIRRHDVTLDRFVGGQFTLTEASDPVETRRYELPVTYTAEIAYHRERWSALSEYSTGLQGQNWRGAFEYRLGSTELRGGVRHSNGAWFPSAGLGIPLGGRVTLDAAAFGTQTFLERKRQVSIAVSLRIIRK